MLKKKTISLSLLITVCFSLGAAQEIKDWRYETLKEVYTRLTKAKGSTKHEKIPELILEDNQEDAKYHSVANEITFSTRLYRLCSHMGQDSLKAIAFILAHELIHHYRGHGEGGISMVEKLGSRYSSRFFKDEQEADELGAFLAYQAGYYQLNIMPQVIDAIYTEYELEDKLDGYLSRQDRKKSAKIAAQNAKELITVYKTANYLNVLGEFDIAYDLYKYIANQFVSPEVANNIGFLKLQEALTNITLVDNAKRFYYPFMIENDFRLYHLPTKNFDDIVVILEESAYWFDKALSLNPSYFSAQLNQHGVRGLQAQVGIISKEEATAAIRQAIECSPNNEQKANLLLLAGIIHTDCGNEEQAKYCWNQSLAITNSNYTKLQASKNLKVLVRGNPEVPEKTSTPTKPPFREIESGNFIRITPNLNFKSQGEITFLQVELTMGPIGKRLRLQMSEKTEKNLKPNMTAKQVRGILGTPSYSKATTNGHYLVYEEKLKILHFSSRNKLIEWTQYF